MTDHVLGLRDDTGKLVAWLEMNIVYDPARATRFSYEDVARAYAIMRHLMPKQYFLGYVVPALETEEGD